MEPKNQFKRFDEMILGAAGSLLLTMTTIRVVAEDWSNAPIHEIWRGLVYLVVFAVGSTVTKKILR